MSSMGPGLNQRVSSSLFLSPSRKVRHQTRYALFLAQTNYPTLLQTVACPPNQRDAMGENTTGTALKGYGVNISKRLYYIN